MFGNDVLDIFRLDIVVEYLIRINGNDRTSLAETEAAGLDDPDFLVQTVFLQVFIEIVENLTGSARCAAGAGTA
jgi:hypothetical protein